MIVAIDIGNTAISIGFMKSDVQATYHSLPRSEYSHKTLTSLLKKAPLKKVEKVMVCSVVPSITKDIIEDIKAVYSGHVYVVGENLRIKLKHRIKSISLLGHDRLVTAAGALFVYRAPFIIIDFGTAMTVDYIDEEGVYQGGMIIPGMRTSLKSLGQRAELLPDDIVLTRPRGLVGRDTKSAMINGTVHAYAAMTDGLIRRFRDEYGHGIHVILAGGMSPLIHSMSEEFTELDQHLTLRSLYLIGASHAIHLA